MTKTKFITFLLIFCATFIFAKKDKIEPYTSSNTMIENSIDTNTYAAFQYEVCVSAAVDGRVIDIFCSSDCGIRAATRCAVSQALRVYPDAVVKVTSSRRTGSICL